MIPGEHLDARRAAHSKRSQHHHGRRGSAISIGGSLLNIIASDERALLPCFSFKPDATLSYSSDYDGQESDEEPAKLNDGHELTAAVESASGDRRYRRRTNSSEIRKSAVMISVQTSEKAAAAAAAAADVVEASELAADDNEASAALARAGAAALEAIEAAAALQCLGFFLADGPASRARACVCPLSRSSLSRSSSRPRLRIPTWSKRFRATSNAATPARARHR